MKLFIWKIWFRFLSKIIKFAQSRSVINHDNYCPIAAKMLYWALYKQDYAKAMIHDLDCKCGVSEVAWVIAKRNILES